LIWHFARKYAQRLNKRIEKIREEDMAALNQYRWPGNVRELQNVIERAVILSSSPVLHPPLEQLNRAVASTAPSPGLLRKRNANTFCRHCGMFDWVVGGPDGAAAKLGVKRTTLLDKMRRHGVSRPQI